MPSAAPSFTVKHGRVATLSVSAPPGTLAVRSREAARLLGVSPRTLFSWARNPALGLPRVKLGATTLYPVDGLRRWLAERASTS